MNKLKVTEHQIQNTILSMLPYFDVYAWRNNVGRIQVVSKGKPYMIIMGKAGLPDIIGVLGRKYKKNYGRMIAIEVKTEGNKTTEIQDRVIADLKEYGVLVLVAYSWEDVEEVLKTL